MRLQGDSLVAVQLRRVLQSGRLRQNHRRSMASPVGPTSAAEVGDVEDASNSTPIPAT
jgi:hypothetical protein